MLQHHIEIANYLGVKQESNESEYDFRKKAFVKMYESDAMEAFEMLFCVKNYRDIHERDRMFIMMARELHTKDGEKGLWKFVKGFGVDPALPYLKETA